MSEARAPYFANHQRRNRLPWSLYHGELDWRIARVLRRHRPAPRVLIVGCGLDPVVEGGPPRALYHGCDIDARAIEQCRARYPAMAERLEVCPGPLELPSSGAFSRPFDVVVAKEVIEHLDEPESWARILAGRVAVGGQLVLSTPNYGRFSTLPLIERTVLEWVARRDGYSRRHIHPSRFDCRRLAELPVGHGMISLGVDRAFTGWTLLGRWLRVYPPPGGNVSDPGV
ncbi:MAG: class I SAM-dependent methyltransferase [Proteobacteria bacterium]|nr:class I SAM-dependent methyltransferase [Pseudomonadota bacterium]